MNGKADSILVMGYGNPGRLDDGLGPAFAAEVAAWNLPGVATEADYQLLVEDAALVAEHDIVVFVDASVNGAEPFALAPLAPVASVSFTTHHMEPAQVVHLANTLFAAHPRTFLLGIRGYDYNEFGERLSEAARHNLTEALRHFRHLVESGGWAAATYPPPAA